MPTLAEALAQGQKYHQAGDLARAEQLYRQVVHSDAAQADVWYLLGLVCQAQNRPAEAVGHYRQALRLKPELAAAHNSLGIALARGGDLAGAAASFRRAVQLRPDHAPAHTNLGNALKEQGQLDEALPCYRTAARLKPDFAEAHNNLGNLLRELGQLDEAVASCREAVRLKPQFPEAHNNLGAALADQGKLAEAVACYREAVRQRPDYAEAHNNLGVALAHQRKLDEAAASLRQATRLRPGYGEALNNLGNTLKDQGMLEEAVACYRQAVAARPDNAAFHSNLVYALNFLPGLDPAALFAEQRAWARRHAEPLAATVRPQDVDRSPARRLRLGYVSPDFREHVMGSYIEPVLAAHDRGRFEVFCYADVPHPDERTLRIQQLADHWRSLVGVSDERAAELIRQDRIDLLIDLAGHTGNNRLLVFARKPAPVQATHFGCPTTTGLAAMDYRLTDAPTDPPGTAEPFHTETLYRLAGFSWHYVPPEGLEVGELPARRTGHVALASFNQLAKLTPEVIAVWSRILAALPTARLQLLTGAGAEADRRLTGLFARHGIGPERLVLLGKRPRVEYLRLYQTVDFCLDPFPYAGCNTSCDALWMGCPVVTLEGTTSAGRVGFCLLTGLGLPDLVARTPADYVAIAVRLAGDLDRLAGLRADLRDRIRRSGLTDAVGFTRKLEDAYRAMWAKWCAGHPSRTC